VDPSQEGNGNGRRSPPAKAGTLHFPAIWPGGFGALRKSLVGPGTQPSFLPAVPQAEPFRGGTYSLLDRPCGNNHQHDA